jgi:hypothetical protein
MVHFYRSINTKEANMKLKLVVAVLFAGMMLISSAAAEENNFGPPATPKTATAEAAVGGIGTGLLSAVVDADGTVTRGSGVADVVKAGTGNYRVIFRRNVRSCTYVASIGLSGAVGTETNASIDVVGDNLSVNGVYVDIEDFAGIQVDRGFHLIVFCNK